MQGCEAQKWCLTFEPRDRNGGLYCKNRVARNLFR